jgi:hypothetical protein
MELIPCNDINFCNGKFDKFFKIESILHTLYYFRQTSQQNGEKY